MTKFFVFSVLVAAASAALVAEPVDAGVATFVVTEDSGSFVLDVSQPNPPPIIPIETILLSSSGGAIDGEGPPLQFEIAATSTGPEVTFEFFSPTPPPILEAGSFFDVFVNFEIEPVAGGAIPVVVPPNPVVPVGSSFDIAFDVSHAGVGTLEHQFQVTAAQGLSLSSVSLIPSVDLPVVAALSFTVTNTSLSPIELTGRILSANLQGNFSPAAQVPEATSLAAWSLAACALVVTIGYRRRKHRVTE
jgi:hypothetical protein